MKILIKWKNGNVTAFHREIQDNQILITKQSGGNKNGKQRNHN
jgi:hypothetical protein